MGQNNKEDLADSFFRKGDFKKALIIYKELYNKESFTPKYVKKLLNTYRQLEDYNNADAILKQQLNKRYSPIFVAELGYNYQLKDSLNTAHKYYTEAISFLDDNPNYIYGIAKVFEDHSLYEQAIIAYKKAQPLLPKRNFSVQLARIYGDLGDIENMFSSYIDYVSYQPNYLNNIKRALSDFITEDAKSKNNTYLKRLLIKKIQKEPKPYWYEMLSWQYIQERAYKKSFIQEKALYKRNPESLDRIIDLAIIAIEDKDHQNAKSIFEYVLNTTNNIDDQLFVQQYILEIESENADATQLQQINNKYLQLFSTHKKNAFTLPLQLAYGKFLAFSKNDTKSAITFLRESLNINLSKIQKATVKLLLADVLVLEEKFNEALILYSQIQTNLKNSNIAQEARFKVAKTSFYKGDFDWAESQLKILKSSTSQLIANDALDLKLLITDNRDIDSTQTALKKYAKADLLAFQNKTDEAITLLNSVLEDYKGESITDEALFKQAQLFEIKQEYTKAETNYQQIILDYPYDILIDDAIFNLAELYRTHLKNPDKAKANYEKIIFNHQDSIYFIEARKNYRLLRGDDIK